MSELVGRDLSVPELKTSCRTLSASTAGQGNLSGLPQVATNQKGCFRGEEEEGGGGGGEKRRKRTSLKRIAKRIT